MGNTSFDIICKNEQEKQSEMMKTAQNRSMIILELLFEIFWFWMMRNQTLPGTICFMCHVPCPGDKITAEVIYYTFRTQDLRTEHIW